MATMAAAPPVTMCAAGVGAVATLVGLRLWKSLRSFVFALVDDRNTGEQRRQSAPPLADMSAEYLPGSFEADAGKGKNLKNERSFFTLRSGKNIFYQTWAPTSGDVKGVIVLFHGFGDHCDLQMALKAKVLCGMGPFAAVGFDLPGHGRSDGLSIYIPDWLAFADECREVVTEHVQPLARRTWSRAKIFGLGESMGGGMLFTLLVRERELFDGAVLVCPMLFVSRDMFPPWVVVQLFKHVLVKVLPMWPITPSKDLGSLCNRDPQVQEYLHEVNPLHRRIAAKAKPRLATAFELAFVAGEWMKQRIPDYDVPSLIIHGGADVVTDHRVSKELFSKMKNPDKEFLFPENSWHNDIFHAGPKDYDGCRERFEAVAKWLSKRC
uniref:Serine aminopeptidase S33 domain-containing protein n=1 Tax=Zooxanthella nutricula TaxID=1333877 RepID=A0A6U6VDZ9_9DINO|mmetsp:Transcript_88716/g.271670  ORF Transcript_88716/g.271670 Transcript_88716/m.271670 type:complete len:380 (+) Transcript_88716:107-1246(+)